jgi:hypothetical protein
MNVWRNKKIIIGILIAVLGGSIGVHNVFAAPSVGGGAAAGAAGGAVVGAGLGSVIPGVGTVAGLTWGAAIGALGGIFSSAVAQSLLAGITAYAIGYTIAVIGYIFGFIAAAAFKLGGLFVNFGLNLNTEILANGSIVYVGWPIVLAFANLGFVLVIIVIAFATIFRLQSYALKQTLWKLIVAALLVNFSLVIAGAFINLSDMLTELFIDKSMPSGLTDFSSMLAALFKVQQFLKADNIANNPSGYEAAGEFGGALLGFIAQLFFIVLFTFLGALTLFAVAIMLMIRYVYLAILLILSPIVWLFWVLPDTKKYWQLWWNKFLSWVFFTPIITFFLYLTIVSMRNYPDYLNNVTNLVEMQTNASQTNIYVNTSIISNLAIVVGLLLGGLMAARFLGITFAQTTYDWAVKGSQFMGVTVGRKTYEKTVGRALGNEKMKNLTTKLSSSQSRLSRLLGVQLLGQGLNRLSVASESFVKGDYEKLGKELPPPQLTNEILAARGVKRAVLLNQAIERGVLDTKSLSSILDNHKNLAIIGRDFQRVGLNPAKLWKAIGKTEAMALASAKMQAARESNKEQERLKAEQELRQATHQFVSNLSIKDYEKVPWGQIFADNSPEGDVIKKQLVNDFAMSEPRAFGKIASQLTGKAFASFINLSKDNIDELYNLQQKGTLGSVAENFGYDTQVAGMNVQRSRQTLKKSMGQRFFAKDNRGESEKKTG